MAIVCEDGELLRRIEGLFRRHGHRAYDGERREQVSALAHALQCAQLAEWAQAEPPLVAAALLHDIGHFLAIDAASEAATEDDRIDDRHELRAVLFLQRGFGPAVVDPVRLHVQAKRFLVRVDRHYERNLSPASRHSLALQGGPMSDDEIDRFEAEPHARDAVALRRWDDLAKQPDRATPPLDYYLALLHELSRSPVPAKNLP